MRCDRAEIRRLSTRQLIFVAVVGLLATVLVPVATSASAQESIAVERAAELRRALNALEAHGRDNGTFRVAGTGDGGGGTGWFNYQGGSYALSVAAGLARDGYLDAGDLPADPLHKNVPNYSPDDFMVYRCEDRVAVFAETTPGLTTDPGADSWWRARAGQCNQVPLDVARYDKTYFLLSRPLSQLDQPAPTPTATPRPQATATPRPQATATPGPTTLPRPSRTQFISVSDDVEQDGNGPLEVGGADIDLKPGRLAGLRYQNICIEFDRDVFDAILTMDAASSASGPAQITITGHAIGDAPAFNNSDRLSGLPTTAASVTLNAPAWSAGTRYEHDVTPIVRELIRRSDWDGCGQFAFIVTSTGDREAISSETSVSARARLVVRTSLLANPRPTPVPQAPTPTATARPVVPTPTATPRPQATATATPRPQPTATPTVTATPVPGGQVSSLVRSIQFGGDDAEQNGAGGGLNTTSTDLDIDPGRWVGLRFLNVCVQRGQTLVDAKVTLTGDRTESGSARFTFFAHASGNAPAFNNSTKLAGLSLTSAQSSMDAVSWRTGQSYDHDVTSVVNEVVSRGDWNGCGAIAFVLTSTGNREAETFESNRNQVARLTVRVRDGAPAPTPTPTPDFVDPNVEPTPTPGGIPSSEPGIVPDDVRPGAPQSIAATPAAGRALAEIAPPARVPDEQLVDSILELEPSVPSIFAPYGPTVTVTSTCLSSNGLVSVYLVNSSNFPRTFDIEFTGLFSPTSRTVAANDSQRWTRSGRPDGRYTLAVSIGDELIERRDITIQCDGSRPQVSEPEVQVVNFCRSNDGRVTFVVTNPSARPTEYRLSLAGAADRATTAPAYGLAEMTIGSLADGDHSFEVSVAGRTILLADVPVNCDFQDLAGGALFASTAGRSVDLQQFISRVVVGDGTALVSESTYYTLSQYGAAWWYASKKQANHNCAAIHGGIPRDPGGRAIEKNFVFDEAGTHVVCAFIDNGVSPVWESMEVEVFEPGDLGLLGYDDDAELVNLVNPRTGNWVVPRTDLSLSAVGAPLELHRVYNSLSENDSGFGSGWTFNYGLELMYESVEDEFRLRRADGRIDTFTQRSTKSALDDPGSDHYFGPGKYGTRLVRDGVNKAIVRYRDGSEQVFERVEGTWRFAQEKDPNGNVTRLSYDSNDDLEEVTDIESGRSIRFDWAEGLIVEVRVDNPAGGGEVSWTYEYGLRKDRRVLVRACDARDPVGAVPFCESYGWKVPEESEGGAVFDRVCSTPHGSGRVHLCAVYDAEGRVVEDVTYDGTKVRWHRSYPDGPDGPRPAETGFDRTSIANQVTVTNPQGDPWIHLYEEDQFTLTGPEGERTVHKYDDDGNTKSLEVLLEPAINGQAEQVGITEFRYDVYSNLVATIRKDVGPNNTDLVSRTYYSAFEDGKPQNTRFVCSGSDESAGSGERPRLDNVDTPVVTGKPETSDDEKYCVERIFGDSLNPGLPTEVRTPIDDDTTAIVRYTYYPNGLVDTMVDARGTTTTYEYDPVNWDLLAVHEPAGRTIQYTYNSWGQVETTTENRVLIAAQPTGEFLLGSTEYNEVGWPKLVLGPEVVGEITGEPSQLATRFDYDAQGRIATRLEADANLVPNLGGLSRSSMGSYHSERIRRTESTHDRVGHVVATVLPDNSTRAMTYDRLGKLLDSTDGLGIVYRSERDREGRVVKSCADPNPSLETCAGAKLLSEFQYDRASRMTRQIDYVGPNEIRRVVWSTYDDADRLISVSQASELRGNRDQLLRNAYDEYGRLERRVNGDRNDPTGERTTEFVYPDRWGDNATTVTVDFRASADDEAGAGRQKVELDYDVDGLVASEIVSRTGGAGVGATSTRTDTVRTYDQNPGVGLRVQTTVGVGGEPGSSVLVERFDQRGLLIDSLDAEGNRTIFTFDAAERLTRVQSPLADTYEGPRVRGESLTEHNAFGEVVAQSASERGTTLTTRDGAGRVLQVRYPLGDTERWFYDANGNVLNMNDRLGHTTFYRYDTNNLGQLMRETLPVRLDSSWGRYEYDFNWQGELESRTAPSGSTVEFQYDSFGRVEQRTDIVRGVQLDGEFRNGVDHTTTYTYDVYGNLLTETSSADLVGDQELVSTFTYNELGEMLSAATPAVVGTEAHDTVTYTYNHLGLQTTESSARHGWTNQTVWDERGRDIETIRVNSAGSPVWRTSRQFDNNGNVRSSFDAEGNRTQFIYNERQQLSSVIAPHRDLNDVLTVATTSYQYSQAGDLRSVTNANGAQTIHSYNEWGLRDQTVVPATTPGEALSDRTFSWEFGRGGLVEARVEPGGVRVEYDYDELGRLIAEGSGRNAQGKLTDVVFRYEDADRDVSELGLPGGSQTFVYDDRGLLLQSISGPGSLDRATYDYDSHGRLTSSNDPSSSTAHEFVWHPYGQIKSHIDPVSNTTTEFEWGEVVGGEVRNTETRGGVTRVMTFDRYSGWQSSDVITQNGIERYRSDYRSYDANGNVGQIEIAVPGRSTVVHDYEFDEALRLSSWSITVGNQAAARTDYGYDKLGNRRTATADGQITAWSYDQRNRLKTGPEGTYTWEPRGTLDSVTSNGQVTDYAFDALGRLGRLSSPDGTSTYTYDSLGRVARAGTDFRYSGFAMDPSRVGTERFGRLPGGQAVSFSSSDDGNGLLISNSHGDVAYVADRFTGQITQGVVRDPWGDELTELRFGGGGTSLGYQGDWTDPETGDVKTDSRWYAPSVGGFRSRDTWNGDTTNPITSNRYLYANSNPVSLWDPSGRCGVPGNFDADDCDGHYNDYAAADLGIVPGADISVPYTPAPAPMGTGHPGANVTTVTATGTSTAPTGSFGFKIGGDNTAWSPKHNAYGGADSGTLGLSGQSTTQLITVVVEEDQERSSSLNLLDASWGDGQVARPPFLQGPAGLIDAGPVGDFRDGLLSDTYGMSPDELQALAERTCLLEISLGASLEACSFAYTAAGLYSEYENELAVVAGAYQLAPHTDCASYVAFDQSVSNALGCAIDVATGPVPIPSRMRQLVDDIPIPCRFNSFSGDTEVLLADGSSRSFEDLKFGDEVWAHDPESGVSGAREVIGIWPHLDAVFDVEVADGTVVVTEDHPFWNATDALWEGLIDFDRGDQVLTLEGEFAEVGGINFASVRTITAWDITVDDLHTFYVLIGEDPVLVHNSNCGSSSIHGNSLKSTRLTTLYRVIDTQNDVTFKWGITSNLRRRYSRSFWIGKDVEIIAVGSRAEMRVLERRLELTYPGEGNRFKYANAEAHLGGPIFDANGAVIVD